MVQLTPNAVRDLIRACMYSKAELPSDVAPPPGALVIEGIVRRFAFHPDRVAENAEKIAELLDELPTEFKRGWTFLNACNDKHGRQWTGIQLDMEELFILGIAAGKAEWCMPRDMWPSLPGGMPYVMVK